MIKKLPSTAALPLDVQEIHGNPLLAKVAYVTRVPSWCHQLPHPMIVSMNVLRRDTWPFLAIGVDFNCQSAELELLLAV